MTKTQEKKSSKKMRSSISHVNIGSPKMPIRQHKPKRQQRELLSDWEHAS